MSDTITRHAVGSMVTFLGYPEGVSPEEGEPSLKVGDKLVIVQHVGDEDEYLAVTNPDDSKEDPRPVDTFHEEISEPYDSSWGDELKEYCATAEVEPPENVDEVQEKEAEPEAETEDPELALTEGEQEVKTKTKGGLVLKDAPAKKAAAKKAPAKKAAAKKAAVKKAPAKAEPAKAEEAAPMLKHTAAVSKLLGTPAQVHKAAKALVAQVDQAYFSLGGVLSHVRREKTYEKFKVDGEFAYLGQPGFAEYVLSELGFKYRKAMDLVAIYEACASAGISEKQLRGLGWTKVKQLVPLMNAGHINLENWGDWEEITRSQSGKEFSESVTDAKVKAGVEDKAPRGATANKSSFRFTPFDDRAEVWKSALEIANKALGEQEREEPPTETEKMDYIISQFVEAQQ